MTNKENFLQQLTELSREDINTIIESKGKPIRLEPFAIFEYTPLEENNKKKKR